MGGPIPCLGYDSRSQAIAALRAQGQSTREIARRVGIEPKTVSALEASQNRRDTSRTQGSNLPSWNTVAIDADTLRALRPHAARRGISVVALARNLLIVLADDNLVDALLDDDATRNGGAA
ncbi:hypothetical protein I6G65_16015 [Sphingomonas paucimobilis]|uniref:DNA, contig: SP630 n=1 Tax=Sphingomonas paucimobilis NBRC 13935 TaxID=1219050 RepID=A0A0C9NHF6_SPHPI|nr:hypothetical protein [Sphingomonas paucimobilis]QPS15796.1 hypothetical protein I6G65_16015 [Sphingomonas paucimobilis]GAN14133.1 hypothetical protein SP6_30_02740 [Sphingomonas paucimobilis NBRC 13935]SUJ08252.1 Uncharacterised protein [Sphingomonas paucimobilis]